MSDLEKYKKFLNEMGITYSEQIINKKGKTYTELEIDEKHIFRGYVTSLSIDFVDGKFEEFEAWGE